ncbi:hypothetical protein VNO80_14331 [Phaseolus coccineus]|uniref:Uncharacterized protein n=1 Tax=Phaseolus coccineus TaxID=3886 RepID=A0AAN9R1A3_PHACN
MNNLSRHTCAEIHDVVQGGGVMREVGSDSIASSHLGLERQSEQNQVWLARLTPDDSTGYIDVEQSGPDVWKKLITV